MPILMYHYISQPPGDADALRRDLSVAPDRFRAQLVYLQQEGYSSITFYDLVMHLQIGQPLPPKPIMLTFDDGHKDHRSNALPLLQEYGFAGTFFVITGFADEGRQEHLSWQDVIEMAQAGMEIGTHSYTHPDLRDQPVDYVIWQSLGPKQAVESRIPRTVTSFCYPFGVYDDQVIAVIASAHYWTGVTTQQGVLHSSEGLYEIKRVRVRGADTVDDLALRIAYLTAVDTAAARPTPTQTETEASPRPGLATPSSASVQDKLR